MIGKIDNWDSVMALTADARNAGFICTNFFPDENRMRSWCDKGTFFAERLADTQVFVRNQDGFSNLYFMSRSADALNRDIKTFVLEHCDVEWIADIVGPDVIRVPVENGLSSIGFKTRTVIQRMSRKTIDAPDICQSDAEVATKDDTKTIKALLDEYFVAEEEQLPCEEEIHQWIDSQSLYVIRGAEDNPIKGFAIFDLSPATLYLRYWFVHPSCRGMGIGGQLLCAMFKVGANTKRQYLWVKTDNDNAIKRYVHYGFSFEGMKDTVMSFKSK